MRVFIILLAVSCVLYACGPTGPDSENINAMNEDEGGASGGASGRGRGRPLPRRAGGSNPQVEPEPQRSFAELRSFLRWGFYVPQQSGVRVRTVKDILNMTDQRPQRSAEGRMGAHTSLVNEIRAFIEDNQNKAQQLQTEVEDYYEKGKRGLHHNPEKAFKTAQLKILQLGDYKKNVANGKTALMESGDFVDGKGDFR